MTNAALPSALPSVLPLVGHVDSHWERVEMESLWPITSFKEAGLYAVVKDVFTTCGFLSEELRETMGTPRRMASLYFQDSTMGRPSLHLDPT